MVPNAIFLKVLLLLIFFAYPTSFLHIHCKIEYDFYLLLNMQFYAGFTRYPYDIVYEIVHDIVKNETYFLTRFRYERMYIMYSFLYY